MWKSHKAAVRKTYDCCCKRSCLLFRFPYHSALKCTTLKALHYRSSRTPHSKRRRHNNNLWSDWAGLSTFSAACRDGHEFISALRRAEVSCLNGHECRMTAQRPDTYIFFTDKRASSFYLFVLISKMWNSFAGIDDTIREVRAIGGTCTGYIVDISKKEEVYAAADIIRRDVGNVSFSHSCCVLCAWHYPLYNCTLLSEWTQ